MHIQSAIFDLSAPNLAACPDESLPEFAFIGRSNVGKSSLLNMLTGQKNLARVSQMPGFTKLINFFTINGTWRMVDLPGYGYARVAREDKSKFNKAVAEYIEHRPNLRGVFALVDSMIPPQDIDVAFVDWLAAHSIPFVFAFTKIDRVSKARVQANISAFMARVADLGEEPPEVFTCSSKTGEGRHELLGAIEEALGEAHKRPAARVTGAPQAVVAPRRPNPARPW